MEFLRPSLLAGAMVLVGACHSGPEPMYEWGRFEYCIYETCTNPGGYDRAEQLQILSDQLEQTKSSGRAVPPGLRAHLAYLYVEEGRVDLAVILLREEMELFPESRVFYSGMLLRMGVEGVDSVDEQTDGMEEQP